MTLTVSRLEELQSRLKELAARLDADSRGAENAIPKGDPLVELAEACEFALPAPLTIGALSETVQRKIGNVQVLLERARQHEDLPQDAQAAADDEDILLSESTPPEHPGMQEDRAR